MLVRLASALVLAASCPAQQPTAVPLSCQVVDAAGEPQPGLRVCGTLRTTGAEPVRVEALTTGAEAIATFAQWSVGDGKKGTVDLEVAMLGATPRKVIDLGRAEAATVRIALPAVHALVVELRTADGGLFPEPLRTHFDVSATAGDVKIQATTDGEQNARLFPIANGTPVQLQCWLPEQQTLEVPAGTGAGDQSISWKLPADLVVLLGTATAPAGTPIEQRMNVMLRTDLGMRGWPVFPTKDGRFAALFGSSWIGANPEIKLDGKTTYSPWRRLSAPLVAGPNDSGTWPLTGPVLLLEGDLIIDGQPAPANTPLLCVLRGKGAAGGPNLPPFGATDARGHFVIRALVPDGVNRVTVNPGNGALQVRSANEFDVGTRGVMLAFVSQPEVRVDVLFDDVELAERSGFSLLMCRAEGGKFGTLLQQRAGAPPGHMYGAWPGITGGSYRLRFLLRTGQVLYESEAPIEIAKPTITESRTLPAIDLRGRLQWLRLRIGDRALPGRTLLLLRGGADQPWNMNMPWPAPKDGHRMLVAGPVDVAILGEHAAYELFPHVERELQIVPKPPPTIPVHLGAAVQLPKGWQLRVTGRHDAFAEGGDFNPDQFHSISFETESVVAADGTANIPLPLAGRWHLQLLAYNLDSRARGSIIATPFGEVTDVEAGKPAPPLPIDPDELARITAPRK